MTQSTRHAAPTQRQHQQPRLPARNTPCANQLIAGRHQLTALSNNSSKLYAANARDADPHSRGVRRGTTDNHAQRETTHAAAARRATSPSSALVNSKTERRQPPCATRRGPAGKCLSSQTPSTHWSCKPPPPAHPLHACTSASRGRAPRPSTSTPYRTRAPQGRSSAAG